MSDHAAATRPVAPSPLQVALEITSSDEFVPLQVAATSLGVSKRTLQRAIQRGDVIAVKQGRTVLVPTAAIADYRARREQGATPGPLLARPLLHLVDLSVDDLSDLVDQVSRPAAGSTPPVEPPAALLPLPAPLTAFIGRGAEVTALRSLLLREGVRLVTVVGVGGVGKTRLALRAASELEARFPDGVAFVPLAAVQSADLVLPAIVQALGLRDGVPMPQLEQLRGFIQRKRLLLILDNVEHVVAAGPAIADLLAACPELTVLTTSRTLLRVSGERPFALHPMAVAPTAAADDGNTALDLTALGQVEAIQLFVDRAQAARPSFTLTAEQAPAVTAICARLDGLPLAIELAAARSAVLTPVSMLSRLDKRLPMLTGGPRDQPDRLRTMRNAIAWSHDLLDPAEQSFFRRLAVFAGGISLDAAETIARIPTIAPGAAGSPPVVPLRSSGIPDLFTLLESLVDGTLLQPIEQPHGDQRYTMLETVREYALELLIAAGEEDLAREAHAAFFADMAEAAAPELQRVASDDIIQKFEIEHDNYRAALAWSVPANPDLALRISASLGPFWDKRGLWAEGRAWLDRALASGRSLAPTRGFARALAAAGALSSSQSEFDLARQFWTESQAVANTIGATDVTAPALRGLGIIASNESNYAEADRLFTDALAGYRATANQGMIGRCLSDLGLVAARRGDIAQAITYSEEALVAARAVGNQWDTCIVLGNLAGFHVENGELARGEVMTVEALELSRQLGDTYGVAIGLFNLGSIYNERNDATSAVGCLLEMLPITQGLGELQLLNRGLDKLGLALHLLGASRPAARLFGAAAAAREAIGDALFEQEVAPYAAAWQAVRDTLGEAMYDAIWAAGRTVPLDQAVAEATVFAQSATAPTLATSAPNPATAAIGHAGLTKRESEVLRLIAAGRSDREIADTLFVARATASKHVSSILEKLQAGSRTEAVAIALRGRLL